MPTKKAGSHTPATVQPAGEARLSRYRYTGAEGKHQEFVKSERAFVKLRAGDIVEMEPSRYDRLRDRFEPA